MNLPIDVVVELLMANCTFNKGQCDHPYWIRMDCNGWRIVEADSQRELRTKLRECLLTLVLKPVLLSECEENKLVEIALPVPAYRIGDACYSYQQGGGYLGRASGLKVIQPVEESAQ